MVKIRLKKFGRKKKPRYRIIAIDSRVKRDGGSIEDLGFFNPLTDKITLDFQRISFQLKNGAKPTPTVKNILKRAKLLYV